MPRRSTPRIGGFGGDVALCIEAQDPSQTFTPQSAAAVLGP
jgi:hypothetical protein